MIARVLAAIVVVAVIAVLLVSAWPQLFGLERSTVIAQLVSIRGLVTAIGLIAVLGLTLLALLAVPARRFAATLAVAVLVFCAIQVAVLSTRGFGNAGFESATESDVTVLAWNTLGDIPSPEVIAQLAVDTGAEVVALSETTEAHGQAVADLLAAQGLPMTVIAEAYDDISKARSTVLLVSVSLGEYVRGPSQTTSVLPSVIAAPADGTGPVILSVHAVAPIPGEMDHWRQDLQWLADACSGGNVIMAGDFNSTLDHYRDLATEDGATLGGCFDGALATDNGAVGTWPAALPALLGAPIDHVMATGNWRFSGMRVIESADGEGSDHRPVLAQLSPAE
jgi:endonuclease/exonuclease/phosphatase (EEP) superfamily protein YafD